MTSPMRSHATATTPPASLLGLAWPLMISFTLRALMTSIDIPYGSRIGDGAVAAIGLAFPLEFFFIAVWVGISTSLTSHLSRTMGARHDARLRQLLRTCTRLVASISIGLLGLAVGLYAIVPSLGLDPEITKHFRIYGPLLMAGAAVGMWSTLPDSIVKAHHDTKTTMVAGLLSGAVNLLLNTLFLFGFGWGIFGIGLATGLGRAAALVYALRRARILERRRLEEWTYAAPDPVQAGEIAPPVQPGLTAHGLFVQPYRVVLLLAVPTALSFAFAGTENLVVNALLALRNEATASIAAYAIFHRAVMLFSMPVIATGIAVLPYVAKRVGEGDAVAVRHGLLQAFGFAAVYGLCFTAPVCLLFAEPVAAFLGRAHITRELASFGIKWGVPAAVLASAPFTLSRPVFEAVQRGGPGLVLSALRSLVFAGPLALGGSWAATRLGYPPFAGIITGLILGSVTVSVGFTVWLTRLVAALPRDAVSNG